MNNHIVGCWQGFYALRSPQSVSSISHFPHISISCEKEVSDPLRLFMRNKDNKKVGNLLYLEAIFLLKNIYSPCINLLNSSKVAVFSLSFTTFFRASVSLRSMLRSTKESMYSFFFSMSVA